jgi:WD40 repeat protein
MNNESIDDLTAARRSIRLFVSYAHEDGRSAEQALAYDFLRRLQSRIKNARAYAFEIWYDRKLSPGETWEERIRDEIEKCDGGLLLVSWDFLTRPFILENELPFFVPQSHDGEPYRWSIPVGLSPVSFERRIDLHGLGEKLFFLGTKRRFFADCRGNREKNAFVDEFFSRLLTEVENRFPHDRAAHPEILSSPTRPGPICTFAAMPAFIRGLCRRAGFERDVDRIQAGNDEDALDVLFEWASSPTAPAFFALRGDTGMGKTTVCKALGRRLNEERQKNPAIPEAIYLDLGLLGNDARAPFLLEEILRVIVTRSFPVGEAPSVSEILARVQGGTAVAIFDSLDEVLVHLEPDQGHRFTRELWRILHITGLLETPDPRSRGKFLISCRPNYFRTLRDERTQLLGSDREKALAENYRAIVLLPLTKGQIAAYLQERVPNGPPEGWLKLIGSIHKLAELASRPYTLNLIADYIPLLVKRENEGRGMTGAILYRGIVEQWLQSDQRRHVFTQDHKLMLMERLAAEFWMSGRASWSVGSLEQWLINFLEKNPDIKANYVGKDPEVLKEDFRTATFVIRDDRDETFRFAHTSLQEFFLAAHLKRALRERRFEDWRIQKPSPETFDFLGELIRESDEGICLAALRTLRDTYKREASELALFYLLQAFERGHPAIALSGFQLEGARLPGIEIKRTDPPLLDFRGVSLRNATLTGAKLIGFDASGADFTGANLTRAEFINGRVNDGRFSNAILNGVVFRSLKLTRADFTEAILHRTQWLGCELENAAGLGDNNEALFALCDPPSLNSRLTPGEAWLEVVLGHRTDVLSCAFSQDGERLLTAGSDGGVRLWDVGTEALQRSIWGQPIWVRSAALSRNGERVAYAGADGTILIWETKTAKVLRSVSTSRVRVLSCTFSSDGSRLASAGEDGALSVWEVEGDGVLRMVGSNPQRKTWGCAFSPDGSIVVSTGEDGNVHTWDAVQGTLLKQFMGHQDVVRACAFSPDGTRLVSAGSDNTIRVWEVSSGNALYHFAGHPADVWDCTFSHDGSRLATAGNDGTVRVWDFLRGEQVDSFSGHGGWALGCSFSPDGRRLASVGVNGTVRVNDLSSQTALPEDSSLAGHPGWTKSCVFSPDGQAVLSAGSDGALRLWDTASGHLLRTFQGHGDAVNACAFSADGSHIVSAGSDETVRLWDAAEGTLLRSFIGHSGKVASCALSSQGSLLVSGGDDGTVRLWDTLSSRSLRLLAANVGGVRCTAFSPTGSRVASAGADATLRIWNTSTGEPLCSLIGHADDVRSCAFSPDGRRLVSAGSDGTIRLWDIDSGLQIHSLTGHRGGVRSCAFSFDGLRLASAGSDGTVRLWDAASGSLLHVFSGHHGWVMACAFSLDGRQLCSGSTDGAVRLWDVQTHTNSMTIQLLPAGELACFIGPDQKLSHASSGAWRWLGWFATNPTTGEVNRYPAEVFGPLPQ